MENVREHESTRAMIKRENALVTEMNRLRTEIAHEQRVNMEVSIAVLFNILFSITVLSIFLYTPVKTYVVKWPQEK